MINFSSISQQSITGKILRFFLRFIPQNSTVFIFQGKLKGKKWIKDSGVNGYWLGTYELVQQKLFIKAVKNGDVIYDIGANVGFYTLLASTLIGENGKVFAFEPLPKNIGYLKKHIKLNKCENVEIIEAAVSDKEGRVNFLENESGPAGKIGKEGSLKVISVILDNLLEEKKILPPNVIKIDIEGAELEALKGMKKIFQKYRPAVFLAVHNETLYKNCLNFLNSLNYNLKAIVGNDAQKTGEFFAGFYQK